MSARKVLITGAGSGLGRALALRYAAHGDAVACVDLLKKRAKETADALPGKGHLALQADVGDDASMAALASQIDKKWGAVDVLINNAGIASGGPMLGSTMEEWRRILDVDLLGVVRGCLNFLPGMVARGSGQVINTASFAGLAGAPGIMSYGVAKAGVVALSEQLRAELHNQGVAVSVICPAFFRTNLCETAIGSPQVISMAQRLMEKASDTVDSVADAVFAAAQAKRFLILPTKREPLLWRLKRHLPEVYFRGLLKLAPTSAR